MSAVHIADFGHPAPVPPARRRDTAAGLAELVATMGVKMSFAKDEEIYGQGEDCDLIYLLVRGAVRQVRYLSDGRRQVCDFYRGGDLFGLESGDEHRFAAEAMGDCLVAVLKRSALRQRVNSDPQLERQFWSLVGAELERTQDHLLLLGRKTACEKVASFLLDLAARERSNAFPMPMGRQDMGDYLGLTIETVSRMLTQLQRSRLIRICNTRQLTILDRQGLVDLSE